MSIPDSDTIFRQSLEVHLAPLQALLRDPSVADILVNGHDEVFVERGGMLYRTDVRFASPEALMAAIRNVAQYVGKTISHESPMLDARLPDGSRVAVVAPPTARRGIYLAIRKFGRETMTIRRLVELGTITDEAADFLRVVVVGARNLIVSGGTGSGKTSLLNVISSLIPSDQRILVLEDATELQLQQPHVLNFETRPPDRSGRGAVTMRELLRSCLRLRPDRIVIGECRGGEAIDLIQAMTSGHRGSMSTTHSNHPIDTMARLETLCMMSDVQMPLKALRVQISSAIDVVVQVARFHDGSRRVTQITEVMPLSVEGEYQVRDIFRFRARGVGGDGRIQGDLECVARPTFEEALRVEGLEIPESMKRLPATRSTADGDETRHP